MVKKLVRSESDRILAGVCGGLGEYFELDPAIFRVLFLVAAFLGGSGILLYVIFWIILPTQSELPASGNERVDAFRKEAGSVAQQAADSTRKAFSEKGEYTPSRARYVLAVGLIVIGGLILLNNLVPQFSFMWVWPAALIALGAWLMWRAQPEQKIHPGKPDEPEKKAEAEEQPLTNESEEKENEPEKNDL